MPVQLWGAILGAIIVILLALFGYLLVVTKDVSKLQQVYDNIYKPIECIAPLKIKVEALETRMDVYLKMLDPYLERALRDWPTHMERDILMARLKHDQLTLVELERLDRLLVDAMLEDPKPEKVIGIGMARARLTWLRSKLQSEEQH